MLLECWLERIWLCKIHLFLQLVFFLFHKERLLINMEVLQHIEFTIFFSPKFLLSFWLFDHFNGEENVPSSNSDMGDDSDGADSSLQELCTWERKEGFVGAQDIPAALIDQGRQTLLILGVMTQWVIVASGRELSVIVQLDGWLALPSMNTSFNRFTSCNKSFLAVSLWRASKFELI